MIQKAGLIVHYKYLKLIIMKKLIKWLLFAILFLIGIALIGSIYFTWRFEQSTKSKFEIDPAMVTIPQDSASIERGMLFSVGCRSCHGVDLAGSYFFDDPTIGRLASANLTRAKGSTTELYTDKDWVRALRHGIGRNGRPLFVMPSESFTHLSDQDLGCLIAFLKTLPPKENTFDPPSFTRFAKVLAGAGQFGELYPYHIIDHDKAKNIPHISKVPSIEYGSYMTKIAGCVSCHKPDFVGGKSPDPVSPLVPNISKSSNVGKWTRGQFIDVFRSGKTPEGKSLDGKFMPFAGVGVFSDEEIGSIYDYIMSLPAAELK